jgi:hypothetical protein
MKSDPNSIRFILIFTLSVSIQLLGITSFSLAQGYNDNEWIFGNCGSAPNSYLSFGKGNTANVQTLSSSILIGKNNNAIAIDPITGQPLFYTNGLLVYNYNGDPLQGISGNMDGDLDGRQKVATGFLSYNPDGEKLFYIFYIWKGFDLGDLHKIILFHFDKNQK